MLRGGASHYMQRSSYNKPVFRERLEIMLEKCFPGNGLDWRVQGGKQPVQGCTWTRGFGTFPGGSYSKASACNAGDPGSIPGSGRSPGEGNGNPLQHSCLENPMDGGAWSATVHGVAKSRTRLSNFTSLQLPLQQRSQKKCCSCQTPLLWTRMTHHRQSLLRVYHGPHHPPQGGPVGGDRNGLGTGGGFESSPGWRETTPESLARPQLHQPCPWDSTGEEWNPAIHSSRPSPT